MDRELELLSIMKLDQGFGPKRERSRSPRFFRPRPPRESRPPRRFPMTEVARQVLVLSNLGHAPSEIARTMKITRNSVVGLLQRHKGRDV